MHAAASVPKKIASHYLGPYRGRLLSTCNRRRDDNPDRAIVRAMDAKIEELERK